MKVRDVHRADQSDGWPVVRTKGSHRQFRHPTKRGTVTIAGNPGVDVPPGTLGGILKQAGLKKQETQSMRYLVVLENGPTSVGAYVPDLPGCVVAAATRDEALTLIREAMSFTSRASSRTGSRFHYRRRQARSSTFMPPNMAMEPAAFSVSVHSTSGRRGSSPRR